MLDKITGNSKQKEDFKCNSSFLLEYQNLIDEIDKEIDNIISKSNITNSTNKEEIVISDDLLQNFVSNNLKLSTTKTPNDKFIYQKV